MFISAENFKKAAEHVRSIAQAVSTTENNKVSDLKAMDMVLANPEVREVPQIKRLIEEAAKEDNLLMDTVQMRFVEGINPNPGLIEKLIEYRFVDGGDDMIIQNDYRKCFTKLYDTHRRLRDRINQHFQRKTEEFEVIEEIQHPTADFYRGGNFDRAVNPDFARGFIHAVNDVVEPPPAPLLVKPERETPMKPVTTTLRPSKQLHDILLEIKLGCNRQSYNEALLKFKKVEELASGYLTEPLLRIKAKLLMKTQDYIAALQILQALPARSNKERFQLALCEFGAGNHQRAKKIIEELILKQRRHEYFILMGDCCFKNHDYIGAEQNYQTAKKYCQTGMVFARLANLIIEKGEAEKYHTAQGQIAFALSFDSKDSRLYSNRAYIFNRTSSQRDRALEDYRLSLQHRQHPVTENNIAVLEYWKNMRNSSLDILSRLAFATNDARIVANYLLVVLKTDGTNAAFDEVLKLRGKWADNPQFMRAEATIIYHLDTQIEKLNLLTRLRSYYQRHRENKMVGQLFCKFAAMCGESGILSEAEADLRWFLNNDGEQLNSITRANLNNTMGFLKVRLNQPQESIKYLQTAAESQVSDQYLYNLAFLLHINGQNDSALKYINQAIAKNAPYARYSLLKLKILCSDRAKWRQAGYLVDRMLRSPQNVEFVAFLKQVQAHVAN